MLEICLSTCDCCHFVLNRKIETMVFEGMMPLITLNCCWDEWKAPWLLIILSYFIVASIGKILSFYISFMVIVRGGGVKHNKHIKQWNHLWMLCAGAEKYVGTCRNYWDTDYWHPACCSSVLTLCIVTQHDLLEQREIFRLYWVLDTRVSDNCEIFYLLQSVIDTSLHPPHFLLHHKSERNLFICNNMVVILLKKIEPIHFLFLITNLKDNAFKQNF